MSISKSVTSLLAGLMLLASGLCAQEVLDDTLMDATDFNALTRDIESEFQFTEGDVSILPGVAHIKLPNGFRFLDAIQTQKMLKDYWGESNPENHLGCIANKGISVFAPEAIVFTIDYIQAGHIEETNFELLAHEEFLQHMQKSVDSSNKLRKEAGLESITLNNWALAPVFNKERHLLYWVEDIHIGSEKEERLSANMCVLGRSGYLRLSAITLKTVMPELKKGLDELAVSIDFEKEHHYTAFLPSHEKTSGISLDALILGHNFPQKGFMHILSKYWKVAFFLVIVFGLVILGLARKNEA
jgi:uncharacterized membrane-anchored protein